MDIQHFLGILNAIKEIWFHIIAICTLIVYLFPVLKNTHWFLPVIKFIAKFGALNKTVTEEMRPK